MAGSSASVESQTCAQDNSLITELPQLCIDQIGTHLDLKSFLSLELASRSLFHKCFVAQRLLVFDAAVITYKNGIIPTWQIEIDQFTLKYSHSSLVTAGLSLRAKKLQINTVLSPEVINNVIECSDRRWTVETLVVRRVVEVDSGLIDKLLQTLKITGLDIKKRAPSSFFDLPCVKQVKSLQYEHPLSISYLVHSTVISGNIDSWMGKKDSSNMNKVIKLWCQNKRDIQKIEIYGFTFRRDQLFAGLEVRQTEDGNLHDAFAVKRADGGELLIHNHYFEGYTTFQDPEEDLSGWQLTEGSDDDPSYEERFL